VLSRGQVHVVNPGDSVHLECVFLADNFNLFDYPVLWRKTQLHEDVQVGQLVLSAVFLVFCRAVPAKHACAWSRSRRLGLETVSRRTNVPSRSCLGQSVQRLGLISVSDAQRLVWGKMSNVLVTGSRLGLGFKGLVHIPCSKVRYCQRKVSVRLSVRLFVTLMYRDRIDWFTYTNNYLTVFVPQSLNIGDLVLEVFMYLHFVRNRGKVPGRGCPKLKACNNILKQGKIGPMSQLITNRKLPICAFDWY